MRINITSGQLLNEILENRYPEECFIPFNEAMITGSYTAKLFSDDFILERATVHNVSETSYRETMKQFLDCLHQLSSYDDIVLWFGDEPFCIENRKTVLQALSEYGFKGPLSVNIVDETNGDILRTE